VTIQNDATLPSQLHQFVGKTNYFWTSC